MAGEAHLEEPLRVLIAVACRGGAASRRYGARRKRTKPIRPDTTTRGSLLFQKRRGHPGRVMAGGGPAPVDTNAFNSSSIEAKRPARSLQIARAITCDTCCGNLSKFGSSDMIEANTESASPAGQGSSP